MNKIILNELFLLFKKKNIYLLCTVLCLILIQIYNIYIFGKLEHINVSYLDSVIKIYGGIEKDALLPNFIYWILMITLLLILTRSNNEILYGFDIMILSRSYSKFRWWISKVTASILITIIYSLFVVTISYILSYVIFGSNYLNEYNYYPNLKLFTPIKLLILLVCIFTTGCICISTLFQFINLIFNNNHKSYIILIVMSIILGVLYQGSFIPRALSPLYYSSLLDLNSDSKNILINIIFNIALTCFNTCMGIITISKKDYSKFSI